MIFGIRRFRMEPIKDIGIRRFQMEPIKDIEIRRFRMKPIDDFWNSEVLDAKERFQTFILKVLDAKVRLRTFISKILDAKVQLRTSWTPKPAPDFTLKIKEAKTEFRAPISKVKEAERTSISKIQPYKKPKGRFRSLISKDYGIPDTLWAPFRRSKTPKVRVSDSISTIFDSLVSAWTEFSTWFSGSHLDWTGFRRLTASCNPPEKNFEDASWMKFRRSRMLPDFHIEGKGSRKTSSGLPYRRSQVPI
ncbi:hypothetical protein GLOIN_2v1488490 [Rhizophagus irregularis DAOM 181602=DAOM 197198]|nr:hypothetical protein GLOIN_2v1488490 [Rhizophagus irregularis DAOM 181602=DAOM 197198]